MSAIEQYVAKSQHEHIDILKDAIYDIEKFLSQMADVYNSIGRNFPAIEKEIKEENEEALLLTEYFLYQEKNEESALSEEMGLSHELSENQKNFFSSVEKMQSFIEEDNKLSQAIIESVGKVHLIMDAIDQIRVLADQIKIYSLNAIIVSSKYGVAGRAFGEISKNIIKLSDTSNMQADVMAKMGAELFDGFEGFKKNLMQINEQQRDKFDEIKHRVIKAYEQLNATFRVFAFLIKDLIGRVETTKKIIFDVMLTLQREDIIRQHLEHTVTSIRDMIDENEAFLSVFEKAREDETNELPRVQNAYLDLLTFDDTILGLVVSQLQSVKEDIIQSNMTVIDYLNDMRAKISNIQEDRDQIIHYLTGGGKNDKTFPISALDTAFNDYIAFMNHYVDDFRDTLKEKSDVSESNVKITANISELEEMFFEAKNISRTFNSINFLAKIELEKNFKVFMDSKTFSLDSVEDITSSIDKTINSSLTNFETIKGDLFASIEVFKQSIVSQEMEYNAIRERILQVDQRLTTSKNVIKENISSLENYAYNLISLIDATVEDMGSIDVLLNDIEAMTAKFTALQDEIALERSALLAERELSDWRVSNEKYRAIINRYSIQKERLVANQVFDDLNVDVGSEGGELTLF